MALEGLENILRVGQTAGMLDRIVQVVTDCGGITHIEGTLYILLNLFILCLYRYGIIKNHNHTDLQNHENSQIYSRAVKMLETYFGGEEESESEINPEIVTGAGGTQQFGFGAPPTGPAGPGLGGFNF